MPRSIRFCLLLLVLPANALAQAPPLLTAEGDPQAGNVTLSWQAPSASPASVYHVQGAGTKAFTDADDIYRGAHTGRVISGLRDGVFYYRARYVTETGFSEWSEVVAFEVQHPPFATALGLFGLGAFVFLATAVVIVRGNREALDD